MEYKGPSSYMGSLFFYGTLMHEKVLARVIHGLRPGKEIKRLKYKHHERRRVVNVDYPGVIPCRDASVRGTLVQGLTRADIARLDAFEGDEYERRDVDVYLMEDTGMMQPFATQTFIWTASLDKLESEEWEFEAFVRDKLPRWTGEASIEYRDSDAAATGGRVLFE